MNWRNCFKAIIFTLLIFANIKPADCSICLEPLKSETLTLPCNHTFCKICLNSWAKATKENVRCPNCRLYIGDNSAYKCFKHFLSNYNRIDIIDNIDTIGFIETAIYIYHQKLSEIDSLETWKRYLTIKIKDIIIREYKNAKLEYGGQRLVKERFRLLQIFIIKLHQSNLYLHNHHLRSVIGRLIKETVSQVYDKEVLSEGVRFFKKFKEKAFATLVIKQYLELYN